MMKSYIWRITHDKIKLFFVLFLIVVPAFQILQTWKACHDLGLGMYAPLYGTFQSLPGMAFHIIHRVYMFFMPLYMLIIFAELDIENDDKCLGNALVCRMGRKSYILGELGRSFISSFTLILSAMMINLLLALIVFRGGTHMDMEPGDSPENFLYNLSMQHPLMANLIFNLVTSFVCALICTVGVALSLALRNRKIVYSMSLLLWMLPVALTKKSLLLSFQPFSEYDFGDLIPTLVVVVAIYLLVIFISMLWRIKNEEV